MPEVRFSKAVTRHRTPRRFASWGIAVTKLEEWTKISRIMRHAISALFAILVLVTTSYAQSCNPAVVSYLVRDEKGEIISAEQLTAITEQLPKKIGDAGVSTTEVSFKPDKVHYYWPEDADDDKGTKVPALLFANAAECTMHLSEATLTFQDKKMRLVFNIDIDRKQRDRRQVVDSLPFQNGTFKIDLTGWDRSDDKVIPATHWKRIKPTAD